VLWMLMGWNTFKPKLMAWVPGSASLLLYGLALATVVMVLTVPQAILLWTEPDMEEEL